MEEGCAEGIWERERGGVYGDERLDPGLGDG